MKVRLKSEQDDSKALEAVKKKNESKQRFNMNDLPLNRIDFRKKLLTCYCQIMMSRDDPFNTHDPSVFPLLQRAFDAIFPGQRMRITPGCTLKVLVCGFPQILYRTNLIHVFSSTNVSWKCVGSLQSILSDF